MPRPFPHLARLAILLVGSAGAGALAGCAAVTNPVADGVPVRRLPEEIFPRPREELKQLPLTLLRQQKPDVYRLAAGDVLGVYIETLLGDKANIPPVRIPESGNTPPSIGYPVLVQENGSINVPFTDPISVAGMSIDEAREAIRIAVTEKKQLVPKDRARIYVSLMQPRRYHIIVVRQDASGAGVDVATGILGSTRRGAGFPVDLPAYENDVLNALARTGGLPGFDAMNEVIVQRNKPGTSGMSDPLAVGETIRIPMRIRPGEPLSFKPEDVILQTGDIVFIESRDTDVFYTGGLITAGEHILPRDYDLDVLEAVARTHGPLVNGAFNQNNQFSSQLLTSGLGFPSPSLVTILRKTSVHRQMVIRVDLNRALRDPRERVIIQPGDVIILQEKPSEAVVRYVTSVLRFNFIATWLRQSDAAGTATVTVP